MRGRWPLNTERKRAFNTKLLLGYLLQERLYAVVSVANRSRGGPSVPWAGGVGQSAQVGSGTAAVFVSEGTHAPLHELPLACPLQPAELQSAVAHLQSQQFR
eukprot:COSAG01_NODE_927_length_12693_cov_16.333810_9_plen_102_part_00